ncbi:RNA methyltransferase [Macrococcus caseolyticus]|uniref:TrmH family RNA methyltransferase n=1 Tax=Macrococcoides caseolyticum TaxID=69966 RepID=UPI0011A83EA8|nr:RNA methyltransferase [Macrococcus caseolyticus]MDJ1090798.1 RNA methyltransferase [Macrococcus caseolyticus]MDJ1152596.1 RNA methyltransferase [Macrococcus caseolyticus]
MEIIESIQNQKIKQIAKLHNRKDRKKMQQFIIEGEHLVEEAVNSNIDIEIILTVNPDRLTEAMVAGSKQQYEITFKVAEKLSQTEAPQGIYAVCNMKDGKDAELNRVIYLDRIQDPGNVGTIIRTADAAGLDAVIIAKGTVDIYNDKVLRASQGSVFHIPVIEMDFDEVSSKFNGTIYGTSLEEARDYKEVIPSDNFMIVLGNEGQGVNPEILSATDENLYIPIYGRAESLNVAVCAGILMYHFVK